MVRTDDRSAKPWGHAAATLLQCATRLQNSPSVQTPTSRRDQAIGLQLLDRIESLARDCANYAVQLQLRRQRRHPRTKAQRYAIAAAAIRRACKGLPDETIADIIRDVTGMAPPEPVDPLAPIPELDAGDRRYPDPLAA